MLTLLRLHAQLSTMFLILAYFFFQGCDVSQVQDIVEGHLQDMILKHFDPKKADSIFTAAGQVKPFYFP